MLERKEPSSNVLLPNALATRILDLELELQSATVTKEQVLELLALYSVNSMLIVRKPWSSMRNTTIPSTRSFSSASTPF